MLTLTFRAGDGQLPPGKFSVYLAKSQQQFPDVFYSSIQYELATQPVKFAIPAFVDVLSLKIGFVIDGQQFIHFNLYDMQNKVVGSQFSYSVTYEPGELQSERVLCIPYLQFYSQLNDLVFSNNIAIQLVTDTGLTTQWLREGAGGCLRTAEPMLAEISRARYICLRVLIVSHFQLYDLFSVDLDQGISGQINQVQIDQFKFESLQLLRQVIGGSNRPVRQITSLFHIQQLPVDGDVAGLEYYQQINSQLESQQIEVTFITHSYRIRCTADNTCWNGFCTKLVNSILHDHTQTIMACMNVVCLANSPHLQMIARIACVDDVDGRNGLLIGQNNTQYVNYRKGLRVSIPAQQYPQYQGLSQNNLSSKCTRELVASNDYQYKNLYINYLPIQLNGDIITKKYMFIQLYDLTRFSLLGTCAIPCSDLLGALKWSAQHAQDAIISATVGYVGGSTRQQPVNSGTDQLYIIMAATNCDALISLDYIYNGSENQLQKLDIGQNQACSDSPGYRALEDPIIDLGIEDDFDDEQTDDAKPVCDHDVLSDGRVGNLSDHNSSEEGVLEEEDLIDFRNTFHGDKPFIHLMLNSLQQRRQLENKIHHTKPQLLNNVADLPHSKFVDKSATPAQPAPGSAARSSKRVGSRQNTQPPAYVPKFLDKYAPQQADSCERKRIPHSQRREYNLHLVNQLGPKAKQLLNSRETRSPNE